VKTVNAESLDSVNFLATHNAEQQAAFDALPAYPVKVIKRETYKDLGETAYGRFTEEKVWFDDGAERSVTRGEPKINHFASKIISPYPISDGDPWLTGPNGFNEEVIDRLVNLGYPVIWLHHQGRHASWDIKTMAKFIATKSVGKSANHDHALFDDLEASGSVDFMTNKIIRGGFSRSAMSGEAFVAEAPRYDRTVLHSDLTAKCFAHMPNLYELTKTILEQLPKETKGLVKLIGNLICREHSGEIGILKKYAGTLDLHPMNLLHELAWIKPLISGDDGIYSRAIPLDTSGVRVFLNKDDMSHYTDHQLIHQKHPNLAILVEPGCHLEGAHQIAVDNRIKRFSNVINYMRSHDMSLLGMQPKDYLPKQELLAVAA